MHINILGIRGLPAAHGGFESFVANLAPYLINKGHTVSVYCQQESDYKGPKEDHWNNIHRIHIIANKKGPLGTMEFDWKCIKDVLAREGINLVLGYNTAIFCLLLKFKGRKVAINMDGIEWKRAKWGIFAKTWFLMNEIAGLNIADVAIADHPSIKEHLRHKSINQPIVIPYGAKTISNGRVSYLDELGLKKNEYFISIARIEPENSILEIVSAFSNIKTSKKLVVLGNFDSKSKYHCKIKQMAANNIIFPGAIYDERIVASLRFNCRAYVHGHRVGGTNPSLIEALAASNAVVAHNNKFNRWVAGEKQFYFDNEKDLTNLFNSLIDDDFKFDLARRAAFQRFTTDFTWEKILKEYEELLTRLL